jgi:hypothetical protein
VSREKFKGDKFEVSIVENESARGLVCIGPDDSFWSQDLGLPYAFTQKVENAIIRVQPPSGASDAQIEVLRKSIVDAGGLRIRVLPWSRTNGTAVIQAVPLHERAAPREVVMGMAARSARAAELTPILDAALTKAGL